MSYLVLELSQCTQVHLVGWHTLLTLVLTLAEVTQDRIRLTIRSNQSIDGLQLRSKALSLTWDLMIHGYLLRLLLLTSTRQLVVLSVVVVQETLRWIAAWLASLVGPLAWVRLLVLLWRVVLLTTTLMLGAQLLLNYLVLLLSRLLPFLSLGIQEVVDGLQYLVVVIHGHMGTWHLVVRRVLVLRILMSSIGLFDLVLGQFNRIAQVVFTVALLLVVRKKLTLVDWQA